VPSPAALSRRANTFLAGSIPTVTMVIGFAFRVS
jgi:hypothetical protein